VQAGKLGRSCPRASPVTPLHWLTPRPRSPLILLNACTHNVIFEACDEFLYTYVPELSNCTGTSALTVTRCGSSCAFARHVWLHDGSILLRQQSHA